MDNKKFVFHSNLRPSQPPIGHKNFRDQTPQTSQNIAPKRLKNKQKSHFFGDVCGCLQCRLHV
jgi:hypothetical protein